MFVTGEDIFSSFLEGIRRAKTSQVPRSRFVKIWNDYVLNQWVKDNIPDGVDLTDKQISDLQNLIVLTDGLYQYEGSVLEPLSVINGTSSFYQLPDGTDYPECKLLRKVWFKTSSGSDWVFATPLKSISEATTRKSNYYAPSDTLQYYKLRGDRIERIAGSEDAAATMKIEYIRYPNRMSIDGSLIDYTLDLRQDQLEEIRNNAVRYHLENISNPRYQSFLQEQVLKRETTK